MVSNKISTNDQTNKQLILTENHKEAHVANKYKKLKNRHSHGISKLKNFIFIFKEKYKCVLAYLTAAGSNKA